MRAVRRTERRAGEVEMLRQAGFGHTGACIRSATALLALLVFVLSARPCEALVSFGPPSVVNGNATTDNSPAAVGFPGNDRQPRLASDGAGNWVAVWLSRDTLGGTIDTSRDVFVARSADNGLTWSAHAAIDPSTPGAQGAPEIATDGSGVWIVTSSSRTNFFFPESMVSRSIDNGATWSPFTNVGGPVIDGINDIATDGSGTWIVVGRTDDDLGGTIGFDEDIVVARSVDNGVTWSAPLPLTGAVGETVNDDSARITTDGSGTWIVVWDRQGLVSARTSVDDGQTWSVPATIDTLPNDTRVAPDIATDGAGTWVAVWSDFFNSPADSDILSAVSLDDGVTWTTPVAVTPTDVTETPNVDANVVTDGLGRWYAVWELLEDSFGGQLGNDTDVLLSRSIDGGLSWSPPAALVAGMASDSGREVSPRLAYDGVGTWMAAWHSDEPGADGSLGDDFDIFATVSPDSECPDTPAAGCLVPTSANRSTFLAKDGRLGRDAALFKWSRGQQTTAIDLGDPTATSDYLWCAYDQVSGVPKLILQKRIAAGQMCKGKPCWKATTRDIAGFRYRDGKREHGAIKSALLQAGVDGKAKMKVKGKGAFVALPALPLSQAPDVRVQLSNLETGVCWEATYSTNIRNDSKQFKATSD